jgi:acyl-CoA thioester hydrolase
MMADFFPEGLPNMPPRLRFPAVPPPPDDALFVRRRVEWGDLDSAQHVNNAVYLAYVEDCQRLAANMLGWSSTQARTDSLRPQVYRQQIEYLQPATVDDELEIVTWVSDPQGTTGLWYSVIHRVDDGSTLVRARAEWTRVAMHSTSSSPASLAVAGEEPQCTCAERPRG